MAASKDGGSSTLAFQARVQSGKAGFEASSRASMGSLDGLGVERFLGHDRQYVLFAPSINCWTFIHGIHSSSTCWRGVPSRINLLCGSSGLDGPETAAAIAEIRQEGAREIKIARPGRPLAFSPSSFPLHTHSHIDTHIHLSVSTICKTNTAELQDGTIYRIGHLCYRGRSHESHCTCLSGKRGADWVTWLLSTVQSLH
ncbi:unnamed protein product [Periconia digitata]|uniref:Uncharacterized protein n=1 Tax=Periconia digitata TaxID=1303443 RepID=A0A9W4UMQ5_9PLEO|nr:unnamed protein product [Periconia digitata]